MLHSGASVVEQGHQKGAVRVKQPTRKTLVQELLQEHYAPAKVESDVNVQAMNALYEGRPIL